MATKILPVDHPPEQVGPDDVVLDAGVVGRLLPAAERRNSESCTYLAFR